MATLVRPADQAQPSSGGPRLVRRASADPAPAAEKSAKPRFNVWGEGAGLLANLNRGLIVADEIAGAGNAVREVVSGRSKIDAAKLATAAAMALTNQPMTGQMLEASGAPAALRAGMARQRAVEDDFSERRPTAAALARGTGNAATIAIPGAPVLQGGRALNAARGAVATATPAAVMAFADRGTGVDRVKAAKDAALVGAAFGGTGGAFVGDAVKKAPKAIDSAKDVLRQAGVSLTPGQRAGGMIKSVEDVAQRAPILGPAIRGARERGNVSLNRAVANRALSPLGEIVPANVKAGHEAVAYVEKRVGSLYDEAADMVPKVTLDDEFATGLTSLEKGVAELNPDVATQFRNIFANRVGPALEKPMSGRDLRSVQKQIGKLAADKGASADEAQRALGGVLEDLNDELKSLMGRSNPDAGELIKTANEGWKGFVRLRAAAAKSNKDGIFTPGQLATAVRSMDKSVGKGNVAAGRAVMQDLSSAASEVMPDTFGNPGTADAVGLGALGMGMITAPAQAIPAAAGLGLAATPYMLMGRKIVTELPPTASGPELQAAAAELARLAQKDPAVATLYRQVAARAGLGVAQNTP